VGGVSLNGLGNEEAKDEYDERWVSSVRSRAGRNGRGSCSVRVTAEAEDEDVDGENNEVTEGGSS
jgi:hypothetical protein